MHRRPLPCLLLGIALATPTTAQAWEAIGGPMPGVSAYDPDRDRIVHVGWDRRVHEWQYGAWFERPTQPPALSPYLFYRIEGMHMVHDPVRHCLVLLAMSGLGQSALFAFDGDTWIPHSLPALPAFSSSRTIAFDPARARLLLISGAATFEFDGQAWTQTVTTGTPNLDTLTFDPLRQRLMGYGPDATHTAGQVSTYDGVAWTSTTGGVPPYRPRAALAFDPFAVAMVLHGSTDVFGVPPDADDWEWNGIQWTRIVGTGTFVNSGDSLASTPRGLLRVDHVPDLQVTIRTARSWHRLGRPASPPEVPTLVADPAHGGLHSLRWTVGTELLRLDNRDWVANGSIPGSLAFMVFDSVRQVLVGMDLSSTSTAGEWRWNGTAWSAVPFSGAMPPIRMGSGSAFDAARGEVLLYGGRDLSTGVPSGESWSYGQGAWTLHAADPAMPSRGEAGMVYDPVQQRTLLVGGTGSVLLDDTWSWNGSTWQRLSPAHAPFSGPTALVFDPARQQPLAINPVSSDTLGVFAHDGTNWNLLSLHPHPLPRAHDWIQAAIEPGTGRLVVDLTSSTLCLSLHPALVEQQGTACGAALRLTARTFARVGEIDAGIDLRGEPGGALLGLSLQSANVPLGGGCALLLGTIDAALFLGVNAAGFGNQLLPVPPAPALAGLTVFAQAAQPDPGSPIGIAVSQRLAITIGD